jgi:acetylornithine deacetylase/succinyl-diaminopimelate desuccinylase-like protein
LQLINRTIFIALIVLLCGQVTLAASIGASTADQASRQLALEIFKQLVEINTSDSVGSVTAASEAMAARLRDAGFADSDIHVLGATDRTKNLVVRLRGTGKRKPVLLIGHLDVVEARREDWTTDPYQFVVQDGYYYGRGTQDMKDGDAIMVATLIRMKKEGYRPDRDIILALTAGEESGLNNGVAWLGQNQRALIDAEFVLNHDGSVVSDNGKPIYIRIGATEKVYADFQLTVTSPGGHSSIPVPDNAIYQLAAGLDRLAHHEFPFELNDVTRAYYARTAAAATGQRAEDMRGILKTPADPAAIERLSKDRIDHALTHTTCVATRLDAGHANNALPQTARANVNCRILPGHSAEETRLTLITILADPNIAVRYVGENGQIHDTAESKHGMATPALRPDVVKSVEKIAAEMWPGTPVIPTMATGASDAVYASAVGLPTYEVNGVAVDRDDLRAHGKDERVRVESFDRAVDFCYPFLKALVSYRSDSK